MTHKFICVSNQVTTENASFDNLSTRITEIKQWVFDNQRKLNYEKTAFIIIGTAKYLSKVKSKYLAVGDINIEKNSIIRNLEVIFDEHLSMASHINNVCKSVCYHFKKYCTYWKVSYKRCCRTYHPFICNIKTGLSL